MSCVCSSSLFIFWSGSTSWRACSKVYIIFNNKAFSCMLLLVVKYKEEGDNDSVPEKCEHIGKVPSISLKFFCVPLMSILPSAYIYIVRPISAPRHPSLHTLGTTILLSSCEKAWNFVIHLHWQRLFCGHIAIRLFSQSRYVGGEHCNMLVLGRQDSASFSLFLMSTKK